MKSAVLPQLPQWCRSYPYALVGTSVRHSLIGTPLHSRPELLVQATFESLHSAGVDIGHLGDKPNSFISEDWLIECVDRDIAAHLADRVIAVDAIGILPDQTVLDPLNGRDQLASLVLSVCPNDMIKRPLIGLQTIALASESKAEISPETLGLIKENVHRVYEAPRSEVRHWLTQLLMGRGVYQALGYLQSTRLLAFLLPEVDVLVDFHLSSKAHHKDVWNHTRQVVQQAKPTPVLRWAALLHDVGKFQTRSVTPNGKVQFLRHDAVGAYIFDGISARLEFAEPVAEKIRLLILYHLRPAMYDPSWSDAAIRRFATQLKPALPELLQLAKADITTKRSETRRKTLFRLRELTTRVENELKRMTTKKTLVPTGLGQVIIDRLGVMPGPRVGELRRRCEQAVLRGELPSDGTVDAFIDFLKKEIAA
ncbi:MAG: HD domain-containing protein [Myxococcota bacterium]|nr:HD domain-containing protein [Myxococcota bacterium]